MDTRERYRQFLLPVVADGVEPVVVVSGKGRTVVDDQGKSYLDCFSGISVVNAGHGHPRILDAARAQLEKLVHAASCVYPVPVVGELAERLAGVAPNELRKSFFGNSGAEAIEGSIRLAKQATKRHELVALGFGFHGRTIGTLSLTGNRGRKRENGPYLPGIGFGPAPYCYRCPLKLEYPSCDLACARALKDVIQQQTSGDVAAFVAEPVLGEGGIIVPPKEYFDVAVRIFHDEGALFVADEVQTGFGRTGRLFGVEHFPGAAPDVMAMAKGIAAGFPLGAFIAREPVSEAMRPGDHLSTFGGNPVSCAAAIANLDVLREEKLVENSASRGRALLERLGRLKESARLAGDVRGLGLMIGVELVLDKKTKEPAPKEAKAVRAAMRERGILVGVGGIYGNVVRLQPPLSITPEECDRAASALEEVLSKM